MEIRHFYSKVAGVTFDNADGTSRQKIIKRCALGEELDLVPDPTNPHDKYAVKICRADGAQIGYVSSDLSQEIAHKLSSDLQITAFITDLTGGGRKSRGVNIAFLIAPPDATIKQMRKAAKQIKIGGDSAREVSDDSENAEAEDGGVCGCIFGGVIIAGFIWLMFKIFYKVQ